MRIGVCQGGACVRNGARTLLEALQTLGSELDVEAVPEACSSKCPKQDVVVRARGAPLLPAADVPQAVDSAVRLLGSGERSDLASAFEAWQEAESLATDPAAAAACFTRALAVRPGPYTPAHDPPPDEPLVWEGSRWVETRWGSALAFDESVTTYEFGACDEGELVLTDCSEEEEGSLSGSYEGADGYGTFELEMSADGRAFTGMLSADDGTELPWSGRRVADGGGCSEEAPAAVRWLFRCLVGRAAARRQMGELTLALADAAEATRLCCREPEGWRLLGELGAEAADEGTEERARRELACVLGES